MILIQVQQILMICYNFIIKIFTTELAIDAEATDDKGITYAV